MLAVGMALLNEVQMVYTAMQMQHGVIQWQCIRNFGGPLKPPRIIDLCQLLAEEEVVMLCRTLIQKERDGESYASQCV